MMNDMIGKVVSLNGKEMIVIDQSNNEILCLEASGDVFGKAHWLESTTDVVSECPPLRLDKAMRHEALRAVSARARRFTEAEKKFEPGISKIPPSGKVVGAQEVRMMTDAAMDCWLTAGRFSDQFETSLAQKLGVVKALAVNSGSSANLAALSALTSPNLGDRRLCPGDEVITAAAGFPTTINPILQNGLIPVFVDSRLNDANIDPDLVEKAVGPKTKAIMAAHTLGNPMDMKRLRQIADAHGLWLIEDCCDAFGSTFDGKLCGTFGDLATLSFYPAHHMTMGEGGAVFSNNTKLMAIVESFRDWGRDCFCAPGKDNTCGKRFGRKMGELPQGYDHKYTYSHAGYNLKITDMQAAVGIAQLDRVDDFIAKRKHNHVYLAKILRDAQFEDFATIQKELDEASSSWFGFLITLKDDCGSSRNDLTSYLEQRGIGTRLLFAGNATKQPYFKDRAFKVTSDLSVANQLMENSFWIGIWPGLTEAELDFMAQSLLSYFGLSGFEDV